jgi:hypothetical protein
VQRILRALDRRFVGTRVGERDAGDVREEVRVELALGEAGARSTHAADAVVLDHREHAVHPLGLAGGPDLVDDDHEAAI